MKAEKTKTDIAVACEGCGRKIPKERLKAIPDTVLCVQCATESENENHSDHIIPLVDYDPSELLDAISSDD
jgi:RNA polymerase-binding transcription factor DksA